MEPNSIVVSDNAKTRSGKSLLQQLRVRSGQNAHQSVTSEAAGACSCYLNKSGKVGEKQYIMFSVTEIHLFTRS